ncbi:MAG: rhomboid family intramembrane serine protease [Oligoflexia bacterium]|nr:rhomboid family intramembrane serine protease [Oligoflexia bacterium]
MARKKSGAVLCSSCRQLISVKEKRCPHCGAAAPALFGFAPGLHALFRDHLDLSTMVIGTCVLVYGVALVADPTCVHTGIDLSFASPSGTALDMLGTTSGWALSQGRWWTLLTAIFLHGGLLHIGFNMMWVRSLAPRTIQEFGPARFVVIYLLSGVGCFLLSDLYSGAPTIGASGAVFGLMGALLVFGKRRGGTPPRDALLGGADVLSGHGHAGREQRRSRRGLSDRPAAGPGDALQGPPARDPTGPDRRPHPDRAGGRQLRDHRRDQAARLRTGAVLLSGMLLKGLATPSAGSAPDVAVIHKLRRAKLIGTTVAVDGHGFAPVAGAVVAGIVQDIVTELGAVRFSNREGARVRRDVVHQSGGR